MVSLSTSKLPLLTMVQNALSEIGLEQPSSLIGNSDPTAIQVLALANREGRDFYRRIGKNGGWQILRKETSFTTVAVSGLTCTTTLGSAVVTGISPNTTGIVAGYVAVWTGIPVGTAVVSVDSASQITLASPATISGTGVSLACGKDNYTLPNDIDHFLTQTFWDRSFRWQLMGPLEPQEWQVLRSGISPTGPRRRFRIMGNAFYVDPVPTLSGQVIAYEYISNAWAQSAAGAAQTSFLADTDYYLLDDDVFTLGIQWRYKQKKGLDFSAEFAQWESLADQVMAQDGAARSLPMNASSTGLRLLNSSNVPDTGFGA